MDHAVIVGYGRVGSVISKGLKAEGLPVVVIDAYVSGTAYTGLGDLPPRPARISELRGRAADAVSRVLRPDVEIHQLWRENQADYPRWKANLEGLVSRLRTSA